MHQPQPLPLNAYQDLPSQVEAIENDGYVYFPEVLNADEVAELRAAMDRLTPNEASFDKWWTPEDGGFINRHINNAFNRDAHFLQFVDHDPVIDVAEAIHGENCHIIGMTAWMTGPGRPPQNLHADWQPISLPEDIMADPRVKVPIFISTTHYYLDDLTEPLGPTQFIPGSHRAGTSAKRRSDLARKRATINSV